MPDTTPVTLVDNAEMTVTRYDTTETPGGPVIATTTKTAFKPGTPQANVAGLIANMDAQFTNLSGTWDAGFNGATSAQRETMLRTEVELLRRTTRNLIRYARQDASSTGDA